MSSATRCPTCATIHEPLFCRECDRPLCPHVEQVDGCCAFRAYGDDMACIDRWRESKGMTPLPSTSRPACMEPSCDQPPLAGLSRCVAHTVARGIVA